MINWLKILIKLGLIIAVGFFERVMGLPMVVFLMTSLYAHRLDSQWRWGLMGVVSLGIGVLFMVPWSIAWLVLNLSYLWFFYTKKLFPSQMIRLITSSLIGAIVIVVFGFGQVNLKQLSYGLIATLASVIWLKKHRFHLR